MFAITFKTPKYAGTYEMNADRMTRANVLDDVVSGEYGEVDRIIEFDPETHTCSDSTEDLARDIAVQLHADGQPIPDHLRDWMHTYYGIEASNQIDRHAMVA